MLFAVPLSAPSLPRRGLLLRSSLHNGTSAGLPLRRAFGSGFLSPAGSPAPLARHLSPQKRLDSVKVLATSGDTPADQEGISARDLFWLNNFNKWFLDVLLDRELPLLKDDTKAVIEEIKNLSKKEQLLFLQCYTREDKPVRLPKAARNAAEMKEAAETLRELGLLEGYMEGEQQPAAAAADAAVDSLPNAPPHSQPAPAPQSDNMKAIWKYEDRLRKMDPDADPQLPPEEHSDCLRVTLPVRKAVELGERVVFLNAPVARLMDLKKEKTYPDYKVICTTSAFPAASGAPEDIEAARDRFHDFVKARRCRETSMMRADYNRLKTRLKGKMTAAERDKLQDLSDKLEVREANALEYALAGIHAGKHLLSSLAGQPADLHQYSAGSECVEMASVHAKKLLEENTDEKTKEADKLLDKLLEGKCCLEQWLDKWIKMKRTAAKRLQPKVNKNPEVEIWAEQKGTHEWLGSGGELVRSEVIALQHFQEHEGYDGIREKSEGDMFKAMCKLLLWEAIFADVPDAFRDPLQDLPLDWGTSQFYPRRRKLIEDIFQKLRDAQPGDLAEWLNGAWKKTGRARLVKLDQAEPQQMCKLAESAGGERLEKLLKTLVVQYSDYENGWPDLVLWTRPPTLKQEVLLVEVKTGTQSLRKSQRTTHALANVAKLPIVIARVKPKH